MIHHDLSIICDPTEAKMTNKDEVLDDVTAIPPWQLFVADQSKSRKIQVRHDQRTPVISVAMQPAGMFFIIVLVHSIYGRSYCHKPIEDGRSISKQTVKEPACWRC